MPAKSLLTSLLITSKPEGPLAVSDGFFTGPGPDPAGEDRDISWFQALLLQITVQHQCSGGLNDQHLVLVNRLRQLHTLKSVFCRRSADPSAGDLRALLANARSDAASLALASHLQLETCVRAAGATARVCTLWQLRPGFLSSDDEGHGRATVALTRSLSATYVVSPPDPRGLIGLAQTLAAWESGVCTVDDQLDWITFCDPSRGKFEDRINLYGPLPWARVPLAIRVTHRQRPESRLYRLVAVRARSHWGLGWHDRWDQLRYFLPEIFRDANQPPCLVWGYAAAGHRSPLWYLWPTASSVLLWHRKGDKAEVSPLNSCQTIKVGPCYLSPATAVDCFGLWQTGGAPPAADEPCEEDDPGTSDPSELLLARVLQGMDVQAPDGLAATAGAFALHGITDRLALAFLPWEWPFATLVFHVSEHQVALGKPVGRIMLHGALRSVARGYSGAHELDQAVLTDDLALQPVLRWIQGISHFLAGVCAKSLPLLQFPGGNEVIRPLCQAAVWEAHILAEVVAGWAQFGSRCDGPKAVLSICPPAV